jgi:hypothetical protein
LDGHVASIFRAEEYAKQGTSMKQAANRGYGLQKCRITQKQKVPWNPTHQFPLALSDNQRDPIEGRRRVTKFAP